MTSITANELKTKGISALENALESDDEAIITVRGKDKYVIVDLKKYSKMREYELEVALLEARADIANDQTQKETVTEHMKRVLD